MNNQDSNFFSSPLVIASRKARWIFDGLDSGESDKIVLLAQAMSTITHGYDACEALPPYKGLTFEQLKPSKLTFLKRDTKSFFPSSKSLLGLGSSCNVKKLLNNHLGNISVICGNNVTLENVTFEGNGERNLIIICHNATLSNVTIRLNGMGLVVIGANASISDSQLTSNDNVGPECVLYKTVLVYCDEVISSSTIDKIRIRKRPTHIKDTSNYLHSENDGSNLAEFFSTSIANQFSPHLRNMEDTKEFRQKLMAKDELFHQMRLIHNKHFSMKADRTGDTIKPRVACIMMQRNEKSLLKPWVEYYSDLFGASNLFIFDNGSTDESLKTYLNQLKVEHGIHVDFSHQSSVDFRRKGVIFQKLITELEAYNYYDLFMPLDCDEFMSVLVKDGHENTFSLDRNFIYQELSRYSYSADALKVKTFFNNMPHKTDAFYEQKGEKTAFSAGSISKLDHGFHKGETHSGKELVTHITYVHFHNKPLNELKGHAYNKLAPFFEIDNEKVLAELLEKKNRLALNLLETKENYEKRFAHKATYYNDQLKKLLESKDITFSMD